MKLLFLDIDGVLNSERYVREHKDERGVLIDKNKMLFLKHIIEKTGAFIVLTSSWREHWGRFPEFCDDCGNRINDIFADFGLKIYDKTPINRYCRESQIKDYIDSIENVESFAILDDMYLSADFIGDRFVRTSNFKDGLSEADVQNIINILNM